MLTVDIKSLLMRLNSYCTNALQAAAGLCVNRTHYEVTVEHFLLKLMDTPNSDLPLIFRQFDIDIGRVKKAIESTLEEFKTGNAAKPAFSPLLLEMIQEAWLFSSIDFGEESIRSGTILMAFLVQGCKARNAGLRCGAGFERPYRAPLSAAYRRRGAA